MVEGFAHKRYGESGDNSPTKETGSKLRVCRSPVEKKSQEDLLQKLRLPGCSGGFRGSCTMRIFISSHQAAPFSSEFASGSGGS